MSDLDNLIQEMYDYFQKKYGMDTGSLGPGSLFLAFEKVGTTLSSSDFKLLPTDADFNPGIVLQHGSSLVDFVAQLDPEGFILPRGDISPKASTQYGLLLSGANYRPQSAQDSGAAFFLQLKGQGQQEFDHNTMHMNLTAFWPASFTPQFWFNDQDSTIWSSYSYSSGQSTGPPPTTPPKVILGAWNWRVVTPDTIPKWTAVSRFQALHSSDVFKAAAATGDVSDSPRLLSPVIANRPSDRMKFQPDISRRISLAQAARATDIGSVVASSQPAANATADPAQPPSQAVQPNPILLKNVVLSDLVLQLPTQHVSSSNFNLSFDYCLVDISRSWISGDFLSAAQWYLPNVQSGSLAGGTYENKAKLFAFLPAKLIVIKNLRISAQWSDEDRTYIQNAVSLGPFSLIEMQFQSNALTSPGMQIIGWLCQVMPVLPPMDDPTLSAPSSPSNVPTEQTQTSPSGSASPSGDTPSASPSSGTASPDNPQT